MAKDLPIQSFVGWTHLRPDLQDALLRAEISTASTFNHAFEGVEEDARKFVEELAGEPGDVAMLLALHVQVSHSSQSQVAFVSRLRTSDAAIHVMQQEHSRERKRLRLDVQPVSNVTSVLGTVKPSSKLRSHGRRNCGANWRRQPGQTLAPRAEPAKGRVGSGSSKH